MLRIQSSFANLALTTTVGTSSVMNSPKSVLVTSSGFVVADSLNNVVRTLDGECECYMNS